MCIRLVVNVWARFCRFFFHDDKVSGCCPIGSFWDVVVADESWHAKTLARAEAPSIVLVDDGTYSRWLSIQQIWFSAAGQKEDECWVVVYAVNDTCLEEVVKTLRRALRERREADLSLYSSNSISQVGQECPDRPCRSCPESERMEGSEGWGSSAIWPMNGPVSGSFLSPRWATAPGKATVRGAATGQPQGVVALERVHC